MSDHQVEEASFLGNFEEFLDIVAKIYRSAPLDVSVGKHQLVLVGGQAIAFWYVRYLLSEKNFADFQHAYTDDIDFFGVKSGVSFCEQALGVNFSRPDNFDSTVNLGMVRYELPKTKRKVIVDIIGSVGGLGNREALLGAKLIEIDDIEVPVISPLLCLRSRINNFYAPYKADKANELGRIRLCIRLVHLYLNEYLSNHGWDRELSADVESIFSLCLSNSGRRLYCKNGVDIMDALPSPHENTPVGFSSLRLPRIKEQIRDERERMRRHLERFDKSFKGGISDDP